MKILDVSLTTDCNLNCPNCTVGAEWFNNHTYLPVERYKAVIDTLHPDVVLAAASRRCTRITMKCWRMPPKKQK